MGTKNEKLYTAGKFAKKAGVTLRTIRYYDMKGLLRPSEHNAAGYRLYSEQDFAKLQKIITLKFLGFSLKEIANAVENDLTDGDFRKSLHMQKQVLQSKIDHMSDIIAAIRETEEMLGNDTPIDWTGFIRIMDAVHLEKVLMEQYRNAANLKSRISLHDRYSTNQQGWYHWLFEHIRLFPGVKVLEIGCGDASLWAKHASQIPPGCEIVLTDNSEGMLEDAKRNLSSAASSTAVLLPEEHYKGGRLQNAARHTADRTACPGGDATRFYFQWMDGQEVAFADASFDIVIANHVLYYIKDRDKTLDEIRRVLKPDGCLYASTIGVNHFKEIKAFLKKLDDRIVFSYFDPTENFGLQNGTEQLKKWFGKVCRYSYEDSLMVKEVQPLIEYIFSTHGNASEILTGKKLDLLKKAIQREIASRGSFFINKESGLFEARR